MPAPPSLPGPSLVTRSRCQRLVLMGSCRVFSGSRSSFRRSGLRTSTMSARRVIGTVVGAAFGALCLAGPQHQLRRSWGRGDSGHELEPQGRHSRRGPLGGLLGRGLEDGPPLSPASLETSPLECQGRRLWRLWRPWHLDSLLHHEARQSPSVVRLHCSLPGSMTQGSDTRDRVKWCLESLKECKRLAPFALPL